MNKKKTIQLTKYLVNCIVTIKISQIIIKHIKVQFTLHFFTNIYIYNSLKNSHIDILSFFEIIYKNSKLNV